MVARWNRTSRKGGWAGLVLSLLFCLPEEALRAQEAGGEGGLAGSNPVARPDPWRRAGEDRCLSSEEREHVARVLEAYGPPGGGASAQPYRYPFFPMAGNLDHDLFIINFFDLDPGGGILDWDCTDLTYDGHQGHDVSLRSFSEQEIGVPIFAALDGTVVDADDGHPDRNTTWAGQPANYVILDHGRGQFALYWHMKKGSVAVSPDQRVRAGQQIGLVGSSGISTGPHLHFETRVDRRAVEPFTGPCNEGTSGWVSQAPIDRSLFLADFGLTHEDMSLHPGWPAEFPRSGQIASTDRYVYIWLLASNLPGRSNWRIDFRRPDGSIAYSPSGQFLWEGAPNPSWRWSWWWWWFDVFDMHSARWQGGWKVEVSLNGKLMVTAPLQVVAARTPSFNRPPEPISVSFDPSPPASGQVLFCRVEASRTLDDLDYDVVRYEYVWTVNGKEVRRVTSAAHADALPGDSACPGDRVECVVTPGDGKSSGGATSVSAVMSQGGGMSFRRGDCNCDGSFNISDPVETLFFLFAGNQLAEPPCCLDGCDCDDDGSVDLADAICKLESLFRGRPPLPPPFPGCAPCDPGEDALPPCSYPQDRCP